VCSWIKKDVHRLEPIGVYSFLQNETHWLLPLVYDEAAEAGASIIGISGTPGMML
jgi:hypothetical protein